MTATKLATDNCKSAKDFLANLPEVLEKARVEGGIKGMSVAIMHKGELVFAEGFGKRNQIDPFTKETVSHLASVTKAFTATAIGELVAEGKMDWDKTPVSQYLPEFQLKDPVLTSQLTLADMLAHRTPMPSIDIAWFRNKDSTRDLIKQLRHLNLPTTKMSPIVNYNNIIYAVAGEAGAEVAGMTYAELIKAKLLEPLGLKDSGLSLPEMEKLPNFARPYNAATFDDAKKGVYEEGYMDDIHMADAAAGDIYMNILDLVKWGQVILKEGELDGKQVLNKKSVQETLKPHNIKRSKARMPEFAPTTGYGLGWFLDSYKGHTIVHHSGSNPGYRSNLAFFPDDDLVIAHLANLQVTDLPSSLPFYIADNLLNLPKTEDWIHEYTLKKTQETYDIYAMMAKNDIPDRIEDKPYTRDLIDYTGEYTNPIYGKFTITLQEDGSGLYMKMRTIESKLEHYHYDSFKGFAHDFVLKGNLLFTFKTGSKGAVEAIEIVLSLGDDPELFKKIETAKAEEAAPKVEDAPKEE
ncbi:beta-lactamase/transpeptidase-like protein [Linnemannia elongata AG-77]|uniref:Beta-lactamase/transpeptidase-like protein n=1 Tax=Linnemannia elongata AG-77 TaxID=1314771 RepID=A0A197JZJ0_9FUNG|nr:beta-lactamase/transpeptidase-like protein [Linnemannia elongata AG-77]